MRAIFDEASTIFDCPDLFERKGQLVITSWVWKRRESEMFGQLFTRFLPLETDLSHLDNGGVYITGVSPDLPVWDGIHLKKYICMFQFMEGRNWFDGFVEAGLTPPRKKNPPKP
jgi:hypothetical protein